MAEAPRKQAAHVGDSSTNSRVLSRVALKSFRNWSTFDCVRDKSGGCPCGARRDPHRYQAARKKTRATPASETVKILLKSLAALASYQTGYELRKEDDEEHNDGSAPKQSHADRAALRALFAATVNLDKSYSHEHAGTAQQPRPE